MTTDDIIAMRMMGGPFTVVKHGEYFWVADKDGFRICAFVDIGHPEVYAEYVAALMDAGNDYCDLIGPNHTMQITLNDAAAIIGCGPNTLRARLHNQPWLIEVLGGEKFGRMWSFDKLDVEAYARTKRRRGN